MGKRRLSLLKETTTLAHFDIDPYKATSPDSNSTKQLPHTNSIKEIRQYA